MATTVARRAVDWVLAGLLLLVPAAILHSSFKAPENLGGFDKVVLKISSPLQSGASWVIEGLGGLWNRFFSQSWERKLPVRGDDGRVFGVYSGYESNEHGASGRAALRI